MSDPARPAGEGHGPGDEKPAPSVGEARRAALGRARLYLCTADRPDLAEFVAAVCHAGVDIVQLRDKHLADRALLARAVVAREAARAAGALFVVNDRADLAVACEADGVHVGQDDVPASVARRIVGPDALVGLSTHAPDELAASAAEPVDYVSAGPVEPTPTKPGRSGTGLDYIRLAAKRSPHPFFVTGGVSPTTLPSIAAAGATRFVVVRALTEAPEPAEVAAELRRLLDALPPRPPMPPATGHRPPATDHRPPTTDHRPPTTEYTSPRPGRPPPAPPFRERDPGGRRAPGPATGCAPAASTAVNTYATATGCAGAAWRRRRTDR